jgi:hypothetical protein
MEGALVVAILVIHANEKVALCARLSRVDATAEQAAEVPKAASRGFP